MHFSSENFLTLRTAGQIVPDNKPQFDSNNFAVFFQSNGILICRSALYHHQLNSEAVRFVRTFKNPLKSSSADASSAKRIAYEFFLRYRVTSHGATCASPSQLMIGPVQWTKLDPSASQNKTSALYEKVVRQESLRFHCKLTSFRCGLH